MMEKLESVVTKGCLVVLDAQVRKASKVTQVEMVMMVHRELKVIKVHLEKMECLVHKAQWGILENQDYQVSKESAALMVGQVKEGEME